MSDIKDTNNGKVKSDQQGGLSVSDIIKMSEEIGADWLRKQSEKKIGQEDEDKKKELENKGHYVNL